MMIGIRGKRLSFIPAKVCQGIHQVVRSLRKEVRDFHRATAGSLVFHQVEEAFQVKACPGFLRAVEAFPDRAFRDSHRGPGSRQAPDSLGKGDLRVADSLGKEDLRVAD
ncbi:hypothetical protein OXB_0092 [Bacillus sp. OxB-1]|nr:hypothetical protein OXB_0092 [Bacillus sp. OxB-1]